MGGGGIGDFKLPTVKVTGPSGRTESDTVRVGESLQLTAVLLDTNGVTIGGRSFEWSTRDTSMVSIGATGVVRGRKTGMAMVEARAVPDWYTGTIAVFVAPGSPTKLEVTPSTATIRRGQTAALRSMLTDSLGNEIRTVPIAWTSDGPSIASVSGDGVVTALSEGGPVRIVAVAGALADTALITVTSALDLRFAQVAAGARHTCALAIDGRAYCWGRNDRGQLGDSSFVSRATLGPVAQGNVRFVQLAAGEVHSCGRTAAGTVFCWGGGREGALGDGPRTADRPYPGLIAPVNLVFHRVEAGGAHTCALSETTGDVWCWGANGSGQLGDGTLQSRTVPTRVPPGGRWFSFLATGTDFTCARKPGERTYCWGSNAQNQLDDSTWTDHADPTVLPRTDLAFGTIAAGETHACGLTSGGRIDCWGGEVRGGTSRFPSPATIAGEPFLLLPTRGGNSFQCAVTSRYRVACWGDNAFGQLGDGTTVAGITATLRFPSFDGESVNTVALGRGHACAVTSTSSVWCWGENSDGQLGDGSKTRRVVPTRVAMP